MRLFAVFFALLLAGCSQSYFLKRSPLEAEMFGPAEMNLHSFTQVKDWTGDNDPDGVEALVEFDDQFGDPTKAAGTFIFELYEYRRADPEPRGIRLAYWQASIVSLEDQRVRWNRISRTYSFQLGFPTISTGRSYVLSAQFQSTSGGRLWSQIVLPGVEEDKSGTKPSTQPARVPITGALP